MLANVGMMSHCQIDHLMTTLLSKIIIISVGELTLTEAQDIIGFRNVKFDGKKDNGPWCYLANDEDILAVGKTWDYCNVVESCPDNEMESSGAEPGQK